MKNKATIPPVPSVLVKPSLETLFHIDYDWWARKRLQVNVELRNHLCEEHRATFGENFSEEKTDWVDMRTGEVTQVNGLQYVLQVHCSKQPDYINENLSLVDAVFRVFLANGNTPMTCQQLSRAINRPAETILHTIGGLQVYKGIRPLQR